MNVFGDERVQLDLSRDDFDVLLYALGCAIGAASKGGNRELVKSMLGLANEINAGNPNWTPYDVETGARVDWGPR
jgi:hypothetical protein